MKSSRQFRGLQSFYKPMVVWRSGSVLVSINKVNLRRAQLVLGWLTCPGSIPSAGHLSPYVTSHPGQLCLAIPSWVGTLSTIQKAVTPCGWRVKAGVVGWQVKLCDPLVTHGPYLSALEIKVLYIKLYKFICFHIDIEYVNISVCSEASDI